MTKSAIKEIAQYCEDKGLRFTDPRRFVAEIIFDSNKPIGAYEILDLLGEKIKNPKPPTVYRAIEFLLEHNFIHKIESMDAYISCHTDHKHNGSQFLICKSCNDVKEVHLCSVPKPLLDRADKESFNIEMWNLEIHGVCNNCR